jgi:D-beta-D-heptose 7-phosphate kinase/D-beta-D-heptose 1-phosphate adenosyltransferase
MYSQNLNRFNKIISHFKDARILVVGDIMLDKFIWGTVSRISPEAPVPVVWVKSESFMPGGASNVANNIQALGAKAYICGVVGDDSQGNTLIAELAKNGIDNEGILVDKNRPTIDKTRIIAHHQQVVRIDRESASPISNRIIRGIVSFAKKKISDIDAIIIEDYGKGIVVPYLIKELVGLSKRHKKIITVDPKEEHIKLYKGVTTITPNRKEAEVASGVKIKDTASLRKAGKRLANWLHPESVLITLGEDGMALFKRKGNFVHIPTVAQEVYDVSGAGDTVIATFTVARASGANMVEAAHISNVAAGVVVGKLGIATCNTDELKFHMEQIKRYGVRPKKASYPSESIFYRQE